MDKGTGTSPIVAFLSTLARQLGFSSVVVGILLTILYVIATLAKPLFGWIADRYKKHKFIFILMQFIVAVTFFCLMFIPLVPNEVELKVSQKLVEMSFCPQRPNWDRCLGQRLQDQYKNRTVKCSMTCTAESWMWDIYCENKNGLKECQNRLNTFEYEIIVDSNLIYFEKDCLVLREKYGTMTGLNFSNFHPSTTQSFKANCEALCEDNFLKAALTDRGVIPDDKIIKLFPFWLFCGLLIIGYSGNTVVISMADTICFDSLGENLHVYGRQRMWDGIGWGISAIITGLIVDSMSGKNVFKDYTVVFYIALVSITINMMCSTKLKYKQQKHSSNIVKDVGKLLLLPQVVIFFCWCCSVGFCSGLNWNFLFWHLEELSEKNGQVDCNDDNNIKTLEGLVLFVQCLCSELPFFFWSGFIVKKLRHVNVMHLVLFSFFLKFLYYYFLTNPWWVLPIELLHGICYGLLYTAMTSYANDIAPPGTEATLQGLVGAIFEGFGIASGNFSGGLLIQAFGGGLTFLIVSIATFTLFALHVVSHTILQYRNRNVKTKTIDVANINDVKNCKS